MPVLWLRPYNHQHLVQTSRLSEKPIPRPECSRPSICRFQYGFSWIYWKRHIKKLRASFSSSFILVISSPRRNETANRLHCWSFTKPYLLESYAWWD